MKAVKLIILVMLIATSSTAQEKNIETHSVSLENLIPFIVEAYSSSNNNQEFDSKKITFLIQTPSGELSTEDSVILKYAFRLLSERLTEEDLISIVAYSGFNGLALHETSPKELKTVLHTIDNLKASVKEFHPDGIDFAYAHAKDNFDDNANNSVVMIRNPNVQSNSNDDTQQLTEASAKPKQKNNMVLLTAIALLPEIISVIKD